MAIDEVLKKYEDYLKISTDCNHLTIKKYVAIVRRFLLDVSMRFDLEKMNRWLSDTTKGKSCNYYKYALRHFLISVGRKDLTDGIIKSRKVPRKKVFKYIPKDKMEKMVNSLEGLYQKLAFIQLKTGIRVTEAITLRAENIDYEINDRLIQIKVGVNKSLAKRGKEKTIYLSKKYGDLLKSWIKKPFGYIFLPNKFETYNEEQLMPKIDTIRREYDKKLQELGNWYGVDGFSSHYLRHVYSDYFLKAGGDPVYLKKALGHARLDTTMRYVSIEDQMVHKVIHQMEEN